VIGLAPGQTLTDTFSYTVDDGHGGRATTTLTITIDGRNDPPAGQDRTIQLTEDTPVPLAPADFGFSDPDVGAGFSAVRIDSLPASGTLLLNGAPVVIGQIVPFASIGQLSYRPPLNANRDNLTAPPSLRFSVQDQHGAFDPQPNTIDFAIAPVNDPPTAPLDANGQGAPYAVYGYGAQMVELEVDEALGSVRLLKITAAHDVGRAINPMLVRGQIEGGIAQGIGMALMEEYLPARTENLHDYLIPTFGDVPPIESLIIEVPDPEGPFGAKGLGEHVLIPTAPAILNAIRHATGAEITRVPALPHRLLHAMEGKR
jgi:hypothetical protein